MVLGIRCCGRFGAAGLKLSAASSRARLFLIEVMGDKCGFLAVMAALAGGADSAYIHENVVSIETMQDDIAYLRRKFAVSPSEKEGEKDPQAKLRDSAAACFPPKPPASARSAGSTLSRSLLVVEVVSVLRGGVCMCMCVGGDADRSAPATLLDFTLTPIPIHTPPPRPPPAARRPPSGAVDGDGG